MTDDKFILMGLDDAGDIAEALKNPTCKKILNFLGDVKEASEKDIADAKHLRTFFADILKKEKFKEYEPIVRLEL